MKAPGWLVMGCAALGCGKKVAAPTPDATSAATVAPPADAAIPDAAPATALPARAICTGRWTARLNFDSSKTCDDAKLAPYLELDATLAAGPGGWTAAVVKPAGMTVTAVRGHWSTDGDGECSLEVTLVQPDVEMWIEVSRDRKDKARAKRIDIGKGDTACMGSGILADATFQPDRGGLPPAPPELTALAGDYAIDLAPPAGYRCALMPDAKQRFTVAVDREHGDALKVTGTPWPVEEAQRAEDGALHLRSSHNADGQLAELALVLAVKDGAVTGKARYSLVNDDSAAVCESVEAKVTGTRTAP